MAKVTDPYGDQINQLKEYLYALRESILNQWRTRCSIDEDLHTRTSFSREEFNDQLPVLLNILTQRLASEPPETDPVERAGQHGLHRRQRGYSLAELMNELAKFYAILEEEIGQFLDLYPQTLPTVVAQAHSQLLRLSQEMGMGSVMYYDQLRQTATAEQVQTLELSLDKLHQLTKQRGHHLRQASHDLRGSFGIASSAAQLLQLPTDEAQRTQFLDMLSRNLKDTEHMLNQLLDYSRLEAGQESLHSKSFDAAQLLHSLVKGAQSVAKSKNLLLKADGPDKLAVVGDELKVQRLVQNLLVNALKYTQQGWVSVSWAMENDTRWIISVQDTGPGFSAGPTALLADQLQSLAQPTSSHQPEGPATYPSDAIPATSEQKDQPSQPKADGEGIGLFIVKRLCELMKGSMDIETSDRGTLIRIRLLVNQRLSEQGR
ncbi:sensor histidine kinase [Spirosoma sp. RP8]|uniref:histidine kinase n=1 Tax=Spirosoma liriopis TaxID=2937440 RepID=A0ABT0HPQ4_9BACT|nr:sensor histidine kinase [Spirosoma liriopis]MCK8493550.1 sensor histidine kinase [Spirosoma liriopis]